MAVSGSDDLRGRQFETGREYGLLVGSCMRMPRLRAGELHSATAEPLRRRLHQAWNQLRSSGKRSSAEPRPRRIPLRNDSGAHLDGLQRFQWQ